MMRKRLATLIFAAAMVIGSSVSAFASNLTGPFMYMDAALTRQYPQHAQQCVSQIVTTEGSDSTEIKVYVREITFGRITGKIDAITIGNQIGRADSENVITFENVDNDLIAANGAVLAKITLNFNNHKSNLDNVYMDVDN